MEATITSTFAESSGHWYKPDGSPAYTIIGKNGRERPTTLRDARQLGLLPSVTTIIRCAAAPGLERWKRDQLLLSALTAPPRRDDESEEAWIQRIVSDASEQQKKAADLGTAIHGSLEKALDGRYYPPEHAEHVRETLLALDQHFGPQNWKAERSFASVEYGFGGKLDVHSDGAVADFKTKAFDADVKRLAYDEHLMQLAAYRIGLGLEGARCANVFVSTKVPGLVRIIEWSEVELARGWLMFRSLLNYWRLMNGLEP